ncbi:YbgA family protein [Marinagarivorans algicola]|uniref:YbgA family protein n=1 Tax=Marinagarivorans algicola TaxID=1513270 RepID=UPI0006B51C4F|nr:DUF523 and DUF1722 domain-containing protein [Marinagarivorans algicola]
MDAFKDLQVPVGISACLMGQEVRYNGGHKRSVFCMRELATYFDFKTVCPEVAIGMSIPRPAIRMQGDFNDPRIVGSDGGDLDVTDALKDYSAKEAAMAHTLSGFIFMKNSPSCGLYSSKVYTEKGVHPKKRAGVFASAIVAANPNLPVEEEGRLNDPVLRESFIARVFVYHELRMLAQKGKTAAKLVALHSRLKYFVMSYGQSLYKTLGQLVARAGVGSIDEVWAEYETTLMQGTQKPPNHRGHSNVLYHLLGYVNDEVKGPLRQELVEAIEEYRKHQVPLAVPMKLLGHYLDHYASDYIKQQVYLRPHPRELGLRNAL